MGHLWWGEKEAGGRDMRCGSETCLLTRTPLEVRSAQGPRKHTASPGLLALWLLHQHRQLHSSFCYEKLPICDSGEGIRNAKVEAEQNQVSLCSCLLLGHSHGSAPLAILVTPKAGIRLTWASK